MLCAARTPELSKLQSAGASPEAAAATYSGSPTPRNIPDLLLAGRPRMPGAGTGIGSWCSCVLETQIGNCNLLVQVCRRCEA
jgi:hypothetical protein